MTVEEALKIDQKWTPIQARNDLERLLLTGERPAFKVIALGCKALEKQIPKKPILNEKNHIRFSLCYNCPECGRTFSGTGIADYCYHCGQALDWNDHTTEKGCDRK